MLFIFLCAYDQRNNFSFFTSTSPLSVSFSAGLTGNPSVPTDMIGLLCTYPRSVRLFLTAFNARPFSLIDFSDKSPHTGSASSERILPSFTVRNPPAVPGSCLQQITYHPESFLPQRDYDDHENMLLPQFPFSSRSL